jgi:CRISPR type III-B/RAMP module RAMP protein Cmr6
MAHELPPCQNRDIVQRHFPGAVMIPRSNSGQGNPGLVFERYLRIWYGPRDALALKLESSERQKSDPGRLEDLRQFCEDYEKLGGASSVGGRPGHGGAVSEGLRLLAMIHRRLDSYVARVESTPGLAKRDYQSRWRVVTGLGIEHPIENGFVFDRSSGVPYFPGTSVKGLCRAAAESVLGWSERDVYELFGSEATDLTQERLLTTIAGSSLRPLESDQIGREEQGSAKASAAQKGNAGSVIFLPAYPAKDHWPKLEVDVVNNHHPSYYRRLGEAGSDESLRGPRETDNPVPVFFLTVAEKTLFTFRICRRSKEVSSELLLRAFACLDAGLDYLGLGAKTAVGYGTFTRVRLPT